MSVSSYVAEPELWNQQNPDFENMLIFSVKVNGLKFSQFAYVVTARTPNPWKAKLSIKIQDIFFSAVLWNLMA